MSEDDRGRGQTGAQRYQLRQKMIAIGNDYWIENEQGETVYKVDGKALRWRKTFIVEDADGNQLAKIQKPVVTVKETMEVTGPEGEQLAVVKKDLFTPLREHFVVNLKNGPDLEVHGNILDHEYTIDAGDDKVAEVSKKWFHVRDSYSVSIEPGQEDFIILAVVLCIDEMTHAGA
jgi:uncharacterized protein YxjI